MRNCWNADRNVGIQLSGGVDSSLVTAISSKELNLNNINTFSILFNDSESKYYLPRSEEKYIDLVSKQYNTNNNKFLFSSDSIKKALAESIWYNEQPLNGPSTSLYLLLAKEIKNKTTVLITGEGADDIFLGYFSDWNFTDPSSLFKQFTKNPYLQLLFGEKQSKGALESRKSIISDEKIKNMSLHDKATLLTTKVYLHGLLSRHDKMFMANGIEGRLPFCSDLVLKTRFGIHDNLIQDGVHGKIIIKKLATKYFSNQFVYRNKIGFSSPFGDWCSSKNYWRSYYDKLDLDFIGYISDPSFFMKHKAMEESKEKWSNQNLNAIFSYINISIWYKIFFDSNNFTEKSSWQNVMVE